jgi:hypothetical protein
MAQRRTTGRFGSHEVPDLAMAHRSWDVAEPVAVWVSAPVPLALDEVVSVLYSILEVGEVCTAADARNTVTDVTVNAGAQYVSDIFREVAKERLTGRCDVEHWRFCERLALAALAPDDLPHVPVPAVPRGETMSRVIRTAVA